MSEVKTAPVSAVLVENIVADDAPAGAIKFYDAEGESLPRAAARLQATYDRYVRSKGNDDVTWHLVLVREGEEG
jgi:hypothetical protein